MGFGRSPLAVRTGLGSSSSCLTPGTIQFPGDPLVELGSSSEFVRVLCRPCPFAASPTGVGRSVSRARDPSLLGFFLPRTQRRRVPHFAAAAAELSPWWARVARPSPVPSSGFLPLSTVLAAITDRASPSRSPSVSVAPRRFAALFHAARVPGVALQSFPLSRSRTRSRGPFLPCGFAFDRRQARRATSFSGAFPVESTLCHGLPGGSPDAWAGTKVPASVERARVAASSPARTRRARR